MRVFELRYPGFVPEGTQSGNADERRRAADITALFMVLESHLSTAAVALDMFETALAVRRAEVVGQASDPNAGQALLLAQDRQDRIRAQQGRELTRAETNEIYAQAQHETYRAVWDAGHVPDSYRAIHVSIYAHAVLYALDGIGMALLRLTRLSNIPPGVVTARDDYKNALPELEWVRNSAHHVDNRAVRRDRNNQPVYTTVVAMGAIKDNRLWYTGEDGQSHEQEISENPVHIAQDAIQKAIDSLAWYGQPKLVPR